MDNNQKLVIIDGSSMLVTAFWGNSPRQMQRAKTEEELKVFYPQLLHTSTGIYTNAVYSMLVNVFKIIREQKPSHIAFVFDKSREKLIRRQWYSDYKGNRRETPEALRQQFITAENALYNMGFKVIFGDGYEADDYAGSIAKKFENQIPVYLVTKDADYLQLVNEKTKVWMVKKDSQTSMELLEKYCLTNKNIPSKMFEYNPFIVFSEYHLFPEQIVDMKAIQGDASDNIPGVNGVSAAAIPLLQRYKTVEGIYSVINGKSDEEIAAIKEEWKINLGLNRSPMSNLLNPLDKKTGKSAYETALLSKKLATIITDIPLDFNLDDFKCIISKEGYLNVLKQLEIQKL